MSLISLFQGTPLIAEKWEQSVFLSGSRKEAVCDSQRPGERTRARERPTDSLLPHVYSSGSSHCHQDPPPIFNLFPDGLLINENSGALIEVRSLHVSLCQMAGL